MAFASELFHVHVHVVCCVGSGHCGELFTSSEESTGSLCQIVCDLETSTVRRPCPDLGCCTTKICIYSFLAPYESRDKTKFSVTVGTRSEALS